MIFKTLSRILSRHEKREMVLLGCLSLLLSASEVLSIGMIIPIMGLVVDQENTRSGSIYRSFRQLTGTEDFSFFIDILLLTAMALFVLKSLYGLFVVYKQVGFVRRINVRLSKMLLKTYLSKKYEFHLESNSSILFKTIIADVGNLSGGCLKSMLTLGTEIIVTIGIVAFLLWTYPYETFFLISIYGGLLLIINAFQKKKIKVYSSQRDEAYGEFYQSGLEALNGIKDIITYNVERYFLDKFVKGISKYSNSIIKYSIACAIPGPLLRATFFVGIIVWILITVHTKENYLLMLPAIATLGVASLRILPAVSTIYSSLNTLQYYSNSVNIVAKILEREKVSLERSSHRVLQEKKDRFLYTRGPLPIRMEKICFKYRTASIPIFEEFDLIIPANKKVAFVGESGAGKSTLVDIIMGLLSISEGTLYYGEDALNEVNLPNYRRKIGYVPQQIFISDDSLEANVAFGLLPQDVDQKKLNDALKISRIDSFMDQLPEGVKTIVGEKGVKLSGGQRQRIGLARAIYRGPDILILDEATSSLDGRTESQVAEAIDNLSGSLTIIIIAHRMTTIRNADIIYVLDQGNLVGKGHFEFLMKRCEQFRRLGEQASER